MSISPIYSLEPFTDLLDRSSLLHLLRRCLFGVGQKEISFFKGKTLSQCLDILLTPSPVPSPLVQWDSNMADPLVPEGQIWINAPYENVLLDFIRNEQLKMWWTGHIINRDYSLTAKMTLFLHNHFVIEMDVVKDARYSYRYLMLLRSHALSDFRGLIREGSVNPAMLVYLNGNSNIRSAPNENYSRELMELFTIGKGSADSYTEEDVKSAAKVFTGWKDNKDTIKAEFIPALHDITDKKFSSFFGNKVIKGRTGLDGMLEKDELVDLIFQRRETALFFCRNIYRWFVSGHIDNQVESSIIEPLADIFIASHFDIKSVLEALLCSKHFFDHAFRGCIVKSPVDYFLGAMQQLDVVTSANLDANHNSWFQFYIYTEDLTFNLGDPPSVAGWPAYYQAPKFHQWWVNSASLGMRRKIMEYLCTSEGVVFNGPNIKFDFLHFISQLENVSDPNLFFDDCMELFFAVPVSDDSKAKLKGLFMPTHESSSNWRKAWQDYISGIDKKAAGSFLESKMREFFKKIISQPEFQMM